jgi:hypothetical protein
VSNFVSNKQCTQVDTVQELEANAKAGREEKASNVIICTLHLTSLLDLSICLSSATECHGHLWHYTEVQQQVFISHKNLTPDKQKLILVNIK